MNKLWRFTKHLVILITLSMLFTTIMPNQAQACPEGYYDAAEGTGGAGMEDCRPNGVESVSEMASNVAGRTALFLFDYSLGSNNGNNCLSCMFIQQFLVALSSFSAAVFMYFRAFFVTLMPILMSIWIAWNAGKLMVAGGADGRGFVLNVAKKSTLFFFLWWVMIIDTGSVSRDPTEPMSITDAQVPWSWFGPLALEKSFQLGGEIRLATAESLVVGTSGAPIEQQITFNCDNIGNLNSQLAAEPEAFGFAHEASEITCAIERTHIVGIAGGLAMIEGAWSQLTFPGLNTSFFSDLLMFFASMFNALFLTMVGLAMMIAFSLSCIWFIFLVLDIVVKVLVIAAVSPLLMLFALLVPTRKYAINALMGVIGAMATALGLALIATLAFYLIVNLTVVYNTAVPIFNPTLQPVPNAGSVGALREFISRMQIDDPANNQLIPMNLTTPWLHYLVLVSLAIFAIGKKIIKMIEGIIGVSGMSEMADNAKQLAVMGGAAGITTGFLGLGVAKAGVGYGGRGLALAGGAGAMVGAKTLQGAGYAGGKLYGGGKWLVERTNPFGAAARAARQGGGGRNPSIYQRTMEVKEQAESAIRAGDDQSRQ